MAIQRWNERIILVQPQPEPGLGEELRETYALVVQQDLPTTPAPTTAAPPPTATVVIDLHEITALTSSHLSLLLKLRRALIEKGQSLILCNVPAVLWGVFLVTGLDTVFQFAADVMTALATAQLQQQKDCDISEDDASGN